MADNKKSFLFYCDWKDTFEELPKETGYDLLIHLLRYVNDENPVTKDPIVKALFPIIKNQLKRDLDKWEGIKGERSKAGKESARLRAIKKEQDATNPTNPTSVESVQQSSTNPTVIDNVIVNDTVKEKVIKKTKGFAPPTLLEVKEYFKEKGYSEASAIKAFNYYEEGNWKDSRGQKVKSWKQKMQGVWFKDENKIRANGKIKVNMFQS